LITQVNPEAKIVCEPARVRPEKSEVERLLGCNRKLLSLTNWKPQFSLAQGLAETIAWLKVPANLAKYKTEIYNI
jgi:nucleoside-diphosphate-sugar epimerase